MRKRGLCILLLFCFATNGTAADKVKFLHNDPIIIDNPPALSEETEALLNSRLIFVYEEHGCHHLEGFKRPNFSSDHPPHRELMLSELKRRINNEWRGKWTVTGASYGEEKELLYPEYTPEKVPELETFYLESLEMEIANVPNGMSLQDLERLSNNLPCVRYVSRDDVKFVENQGPGTTFEHPSDPLYQYQWSLKREDDNFGVDVESLWSENAWTGSDNMVIAIIDSGCNLNHPDMVDQYWRNTGEKNCNDGIDDDNNGFIDDCYGWDFVDGDNNPEALGTSHGTAAAGIIAAKSNNAAGVSGICWNCKLLCLRFISNTEGTVANEVRAIDYAVKMGAKISNNSYGGYAHQGSRVEKDAIERAHRHGHIFVSSAGNNNMGTDTSEFIHTPSGYPLKNIVSVGASTETGRKTSFSNYGKRTVHIFAPGRNIISTGKDGYLVNQGTSFAAPHVAGVAGLIWSKYPDLSNEQIIESILGSCRPSKDLRNLADCGGVLNAPAAMQLAEKMAAGFSHDANADVLPVEQEPQRDDSLEDDLFGDFGPIMYPFGFSQDLPSESFDWADGTEDGLQPLDTANRIGHEADEDSLISLGNYFSRSQPQPQPFSSRDWPTNAGYGSAVKASSVTFGDRLLKVLPTTKRLVNWPIDAVVDLVNAGLDTYPNPGALMGLLNYSARRVGQRFSATSHVLADLPISRPGAALTDFANAVFGGFSHEEKKQDEVATLFRAWLKERQGR